MIGEAQESSPPIEFRVHQIYDDNTSGQIFKVNQQNKYRYTVIPSRDINNQSFVESHTFTWSQRTEIGTPSSVVEFNGSEASIYFPYVGPELTKYEFEILIVDEHSREQTISFDVNAHPQFKCPGCTDADIEQFDNVSTELVSGVTNIAPVNRNEIYASGDEENQISKLNLGQELTRTILEVGIKPDILDFDPDTQTLFVSELSRNSDNTIDTESTRLLQINTTTETQLETELPGRIWNIFADRSGGAYIFAGPETDYSAMYYVKDGTVTQLAIPPQFADSISYYIDFDRLSGDIAVADYYNSSLDVYYGYSALEPTSSNSRDLFNNPLPLPEITAAELEHSTFDTVEQYLSSFPDFISNEFQSIDDLQVVGNSIYMIIASYRTFAFKDVHRIDRNDLNNTQDSFTLEGWQMSLLPFQHNDIFAVKLDDKLQFIESSTKDTVFEWYFNDCPRATNVQVHMSPEEDTLFVLLNDCSNTIINAADYVYRIPLPSVLVD